METNVMNVADNQQSEMSANETEKAAIAVKKCNIRKDYYTRIASIVELMGDESLDVSGYVNMILEQHFEKFGEAVKTLFNNGNAKKEED